ncbi:54S ribosomal protein L10, mitochondrial [Candida viswanathii]|uniref:54S ribosomal protein L10, mitochondrial n=1 Tax=Candida viswanathii TaxID=5486 RepID=A0A367XMQ4_9ASCO|nr:54S ribosomal protein L10, mitochondrial [Candida viswanathii]
MFSLPSFTQRFAFKGVNVLTSFRQLSKLGTLKPNEGSTQGYKRLGRGASSGKGKTSGRGQKGQKARGKVPWWHEGGQTPYYRRFPLTGFSNPNRRIYQQIKLARIQEFWNTGRIPLKEGDTLTIQEMVKCGLVTRTLRHGVKILAAGASNYNVPLNIEASKGTAVAIETIEKIGRTFTAKYFSRLGIRAHVHPERFLLKYGYVPMEARPSQRRDINYYSNPEKRGYLAKDRSILHEPLEKARAERADEKKVVKVVSKFKSLDEQLQEAIAKEGASA